MYNHLESPEILDVTYRAAEILQVNMDQPKDISNQTNFNCSCPRYTQEFKKSLNNTPDQGIKN